jgi:hypothetical protein
MPVDKEYASLCFPAEFSVKVIAICNFCAFGKGKTLSIMQAVCTEDPVQSTTTARLTTSKDDCNHSVYSHISMVS